MKEYSVNVGELIIRNEKTEKNIYGKLYSPDSEGRFPTVILSHGYNGGHPNYENECMYFASKGFVAYAFDFCGGSNWSKSDGESTEMTIFTEKDDLLAVFDYISAMNKTDSERVYLLGGSQGGCVTALAAVERADAVKGLVLYFPALNIPDDWRGRYPSVDNIPEVTDFWDLKLGKEFFTSIHDFNTFEVIGGYKKDVLLLQGDSDDIVKLAVAEKAAEVYESCKLIVFEGEGHGFSDKISKKAMELALEFMCK